jgi:hypothetical protein
MFKIMKNEKEGTGRSDQRWYYQSGSSSIDYLP